MKDIIVFGTGTTSKIVISGLKDDVNVVCFCDNDETKWGKYYNNKVIMPPYKINNISFDYIIIASQFCDEINEQLIGSGIEQSKIFQFFTYVDSLSNCAKTDLEKIKNSSGNVEGIVTGISYVEAGIKENLFSRDVVKMARHSQDLYFDYSLVKYSLKNYREKLNYLKNVIIGVCYYSFEYDMSLSAMNWKTRMYYEAIGEKHNFKDIEGYIQKVEINKKNASEILKLYPDGQPQVEWFFRSNSEIVENLNDEIGKYQALLDANKDYPMTVIENRKILIKYLKLLKENGINPIVIVCPVSKYYSRYFPQKLRKEFYSIISDIQKEIDFQFLDYFDSELFKDDDFYDVSHLNNKGAERFTIILNEAIEW